MGALAASASGSWWFRRRNPERSGALTRVLLAGVEVLVEGQVQGVGYRAFALRRARDRGLTGYTLNLPDGRVKVRVEGNRQTIDLYVHRVRKRAGRRDLWILYRVTPTRVVFVLLTAVPPPL